MFYSRFYNTTADVTRKIGGNYSFPDISSTFFLFHLQGRKEYRNKMFIDIFIVLKIIVFLERLEYSKHNSISERNLKIKT